MSQPTPIQPTVELALERGATPRGGGRIDARLTVTLPTDDAAVRDPRTVALVVDRSGSMAGRPIEVARSAAKQALSVLEDGDGVAVVTFDQAVDVAQPTVAVGPDRSAILAAIDAIRTGGTTALHAGWVEGLTQALARPDDAGRTRVLLLSDGCANVGECDPSAIARDVGDAYATMGVGTSAIGLGAHFDERLLRAMAEAGGGTFTYVDRLEQLPDLLETELASLAALRGRQVTLAFDGAAARFVDAGEGVTVESGRLRLPDLIEGMTRSALVTIELDPGAELPPLRLTWRDLDAGRTETLRVTVDVERIDDEAYAQRDVDDAVAALRRQRDAADATERIEGHVRAGRRDDAKYLLRTLANEVETWPDDELRSEQAAALQRIDGALDRLDDAAAAKAAYARSYDVKGGHARIERERMRDDQRRKRAAAAAARTARPTGLPPLQVQRTLTNVAVPHADGRASLVEVAIGDLTELAVDAIVNPSNRGLFGTSGVDGAIHAKGGPELTAACRAIGGIDRGDAVVTEGFRLPAAHVIHTAAAPWRGGGAGELELLERCYRNALDVAQRLRYRHVAFPAIGTGTYGYPPGPSTEVAVRSVLEGLEQRRGVERVTFVLIDRTLARRFADELRRQHTVGPATVVGAEVP